MIEITYPIVIILISSIWILQRIILTIKNKKINIKRELQLLWVYVCIIAIVRITFFPFLRVDGRVQPLILDLTNMFPPRVNWIPIVSLLDYPQSGEIIVNVMGNVAMFIPLGIIYPIVYKELNTHKRVIGAGIGFSLCIEILQLPFYDRVTDIDDLILNSLGFVIGYVVYRYISARGRFVFCKERGEKS